MSIHMTMHMSIHMHIHMSIHMSICMFIDCKPSQASLRAGMKNCDDMPTQAAADMKEGRGGYTCGKIGGALHCCTTFLVVGLELKHAKETGVRCGV